MPPRVPRREQVRSRQVLRDDPLITLRTEVLVEAVDIVLRLGQLPFCNRQRHRQRQARQWSEQVRHQLPPLGQRPLGEVSTLEVDLLTLITRCLQPQPMLFKDVI